jgi:hypothetical protein
VCVGKCSAMMGYAGVGRFGLGVAARGKKTQEVLPTNANHVTLYQPHRTGDSGNASYLTHSVS